MNDLVRVEAWLQDFTLLFVRTVKDNASLIWRRLEAGQENFAHTHDGFVLMFKHVTNKAVIGFPDSRLVNSAPDICRTCDALKNETFSFHVVSFTVFRLFSRFRVY